MSNSLHLDANEQAFFQRQLEYVKTRTYDTKYKNLKATTLIPVSNEAPSGADFITYRAYTAVGFAKIVADYVKDFPRVDVYGEEKTAKVKSLGDSYGYSIKEIRRAQMANVPLETKKATAARRAIDELVDRIAWKGDAAAGLNGLINYPGTTEYTVLADGTGSSKLWSTKTSDQIVRDIVGLINAVWVTTNGREVPNTLILPLEKYNILATKRMDGNSDTTIMKYLRDNIPYLELIDWVSDLKGAGAGGTDRMMVYVRDEEHLTLEIPQQFEQFAPQQTGMEYEIPCHAEVAGVIVYYPLSVAWGDGI